MEHAARNTAATTNILFLDCGAALAARVRSTFFASSVAITIVDSYRQAIDQITRKRITWHCWALHEEAGGVELLEKYPHHAYCIILSRRPTAALYKKAMRLGAFDIHDHTPGLTRELSAKIRHAAALNHLLDGSRSDELHRFQLLANTPRSVQAWSHAANISVRHLYRLCKTHCGRSAADVLRGYRELTTGMQSRRYRASAFAYAVSADAATA